MLRSTWPLCAAAFLLMFGVGMIVSLLPMKLMALSHGPVQVGYLASAFALTFVPAQLPVGRLAGKWGFRPLICLGYAISALAGFLYFTAQTPAQLLAARMLQGLGEAPLWSLAPALLAIEHPRQRGRAMGIYNAAVHTGLTLGSLSGMGLIPYCDTQLFFPIHGGLCLTGALVTRIWVMEPRRHPAPARTKAPSTTMETRILFLGILLYGAGYGLFVTTIPGYLVTHRGLNQATIGLFFTLFYLGISLSQPLAGHISDRRGSKPVILGSLVLILPGMALFHNLSLVPAMGLLTVSALGLGSFCVASLARLNQGIRDDLKGWISGCFYLFWGLGYFSIPLAMGVVEEMGMGQAGFGLLSLAWLLTLGAAVRVLD
ncbi:MAG: MFS transporter [Desulfobacterales bacterium]|nr:MFS transporter [Desulfobacterales bacterium]